jgi:hypothetical protein
VRSCSLLRLALQARPNLAQGGGDEVSVAELAGHEGGGDGEEEEVRLGLVKLIVAREQKSQLTMTNHWGNG